MADDPTMKGNRSRNETNGRLRDTRNDKHVETLEKQYDRNFGVRGDMHIDTLLKKEGVTSVHELMNKKK